MRTFVLAALAAALVAGTARAAPVEDDLDELYAEAHPPPRHAAAAPTPLGRWYGWQTLLADAAFITVLASVPAWGEVRDGGGVALGFDALGFLATSPAIHARHGNADAGLYAMLLELGLTSLGTVAGFGIGAVAGCASEPAALFSVCGHSNAGWGAYGGALVGAGLAAVVDAVALAWEAPDASHVSRATSSIRWTVAPFGLRGGAGVGVAAAF